MGLFNNFPYMDLSNLNLDFVLKKLKDLTNYTESAKQDANRAEAAKTIAVTAQTAAESASRSAESSARDAQTAETSAENYAAHIADPVSGLVTTWLGDHITNPSNPPLDTSLSVANAAADSKAAGDAIRNLQAQILQGVPYEVKLAINNILQNVAYKNDADYSADKTVVNQWATDITVSSISAVYTQSGPVYSTDDLAVLRNDLVVTATYSNGASGPVNGYTLSGALEYGNSVITAAYGGKTATFTVSVTDVTIIPIEYHGLNETVASGSTYAQCKNTTNQRYRPVDLISVQEGDKLVVTGDNVPSGQYLSLWALYFGNDQLYTGVNTGEWLYTELTIPSGYPYAGVSIAKKPNVDNLTSVTNLTLKRLRSPQ